MLTWDSVFISMRTKPSRESKMSKYRCKHIPTCLQARNATLPQHDSGTSSTHNHLHDDHILHPSLTSTCGIVPAAASDAATHPGGVHASSMKLLQNCTYTTRLPPICTKLEGSRAAKRTTSGEIRRKIDSTAKFSPCSCRGSHETTRQSVES